MSTENLPASLQGLAQGLSQSASSQGSGSDGYMKFTKGLWSSGQDDDEVEEGALYAINPQGCRHGFIAWGNKNGPKDGMKCGDVMCDATSPLMAIPEAVQDATWQQQVEMQISCVEGADKGAQYTINFSSLGGRKAYKAVLNEIVGALSEGSTFIVPIVELCTGGYKHPKHGPIKTPDFKIVDWADLEGNREGNTPALEEVKDTPAPPARASRRPTIRFEGTGRPGSGG